MPTVLGQDRIAEANASLEAQDASGVLRWALETFGEKVALATSFGAEDMVVLDLLTRETDAPCVFTLDTGRLPQQTYDLMQKVKERYGLSVRIIFPEAEAVERMVAEKGPNLFYESIQNRKLCCRIRKVLPLQRALKSLDAWMTGLTRYQAVTRVETKKVEWDEGNGLVKINPIVDWTHEQVWDYIREQEVPYNALHDEGYPSIGCAPCTRAVKPGEDLRAGRWWWEAPEQKECGLHLKS